MKRAAYIAMGANQGDLVDTLNAAVDVMRSLEQSELVAVSPFYKTAPIEAEGPDFLNAVVRLDTDLEPYGLLLHLLDIELMLGRKRRIGSKPNAPRNVDLDLLMVGDMIVQSTPLTLPHPRMHKRAFVLRPLLDLDPQIRVPSLGLASELIAALGDQRVTPMEISPSA